MTNFRASAAAEYLGPDDFSRGNTPSNGNGHSNGNGNGHAKIFELKPATDPVTLSILEARRNALQDDRLGRSEKAAFCEILDRSLNPSFWDVRGVVTLSDSILAQTFRVSNRTVYTWKKKLEAAGYVWLTQKFKSNMWPITTYHLSCLHKPKAQTKTDSDGTYGGGRCRPAPAAPGLGARKPGQPGLPLPGSRQPAPESKSEDLQAISGGTGNGLPARAEANFGSEPKLASGESRSPLRARAEANFGSEPKLASGESRNSLPVTPEADCRHLESQKREGGILGSVSKRSTGLNALKAGLGKKASRENTFLLDVAATMDAWRKGHSGAELKNSGAWWRLAFRADAGLMERVLAEVRGAVKEGRIDETPGQYAADIWKRWGGTLEASKGARR